tara:strand:- start:332 stop:652 length:321 start_codon:yes stop_codon:yes gene_type:complete
MASKQIDRWLKSEIEKVPERIIRFRDNSKENKMTYYTGNWSKDVQDNMTERQSEKLFKKMNKIHEGQGLAFFQKRMRDIKIGANDYDEAETITGFQYIVIRTNVGA